VIHRHIPLWIHCAAAISPASRPNGARVALQQASQLAHVRDIIEVPHHINQFINPLFAHHMPREPPEFLIYLLPLPALVRKVEGTFHAWSGDNPIKFAAVAAQATDPHDPLA
jgi:hypothetical protein